MNGLFFKDMILFGGLEYEKVFGKKYGYGYVVVVVIFLKEWDERVLYDFFICYFFVSCEWLIMFR